MSVSVRQLVLSCVVISAPLHPESWAHVPNAGVQKQGEQLHDRRQHDAPGPLDATRPNETLAKNWQVQDVGFGTKPSFDFDSHNRLHVMGMTEDFNGQVWYANSETINGPWEPRTISSGYFYGPGDLRVASDDAVHIAWHNHDHEDPNHYRIMADGQEDLFRIPSPGHNGWDNSLTPSNDGRLFQGSINPSDFGATTSLELGEFNGSRWSYQSVTGSGPAMYGLNTSVAVDSNDQPHLVYCSCDDWATPGDLNYARRSDSGWDVESLVTGGIRGRFPVIAIDERDRSHIAWVDIDTLDQEQGLVQYGVLDGDSFEFETVGELKNIQLGFGGARKLVSLDLDSHGQPHIAFGDEKLIKYGVRSENGWETTTVLESIDPTYNGQVVMRLDSSDNPAIVFWQPDDQQAGVVRIASIASGPPLQAGDANQDLKFDQLDLVQVVSAQKFLSGEPATWGEGDWNGAPGGSPGSPPAGDGKFENRDVIAALAAGKWLTGPYAARAPSPSTHDLSFSIGYDAGTGRTWIETPDDAELTSIDLRSNSGILGHGEPQFLDGVFDNASPHNIFKATFGGSFSDVDFGSVAEPGLAEAFVLRDLSATASLAAGGERSHFELNYIAVPEPHTLPLMLCTLFLVTVCGPRFGPIFDLSLAYSSNCKTCWHGRLLDQTADRVGS